MAIYKLGEITSKAPTWKKDKTDLYIDLAGSDLKSLKTISPNLFPLRAKWLIQEETILIGRVRPANKNHTFISSGRYVASSGFSAFAKGKSDIALLKYIWYKLQSDQFTKFCIENAIGSTYPEISSKALDEYPLFLPSVKEQQAIIDIIEQNEKLFLAYSNCVRIDSVDNVQSDMKKLIDIIEPVEAFENNISKLVRAIELLTKNLESNSGYVFGDFVSIIKNKPKNIKQVSAKVLNRRTSLISQLENPNTYTTNNFFAPKGTLVINTIRTYLEKFGLLYDDADANGTLAMFEMKDATSVFHNLLNDDFWSQALLLSHGTKMPVIKTKDLLSINARKTETEIVGLQNLLISLATLSTRISNLKNRLINLLII